MTTQHYYYADLVRNGQIFELDNSELQAELADLGVSKIEELNDYDRRFFKSLDDCNEFLDEYEETEERLRRGDFCKSKALPCLIYKRRYLILSAMRVKLQTFRKYSKNWKTGQLFNLYDQTYYVTAKLKKITYDSKEKLYCYDFEIMEK